MFELTFYNSTQFVDLQYIAVKEEWMLHIYTHPQGWRFFEKKQTAVFATATTSTSYTVR